MSDERSDEEWIKIEIVDVAYAGDGVGHLPDGRAAFVPRTLPGEVVEIEIVEERTKYVRGEVREWHERSPRRVEPECPYFGECGGCQYWHTAYERELELKTRAAREVIERNFGAELPQPEVVSAPSERRYRNRVRFHRRLEPSSSNWPVGFFSRGSDSLVEVDDCLVTVDPVNEGRRVLEPGLVDVGEVDVRIETAGSGEVVASIEPEDRAPEEPPDSLISFAESLEDHPVLRGVRYLGEDRIWVGGDATVDGDQVLAEVPVESIRLPAGLFRQANSALNRELVSRVRERFAASGADALLELFCGVGNFSFPLSGVADSVVGLEVDEVAVEMAQTMAEFSQTEGLSFFEADLSGGFEGLEVLEEIEFDAVLLDPPRGGASEVCRDLVDADVHTIVYVSCDPPALGRDLETLAGGGWKLRGLEMFDLFPRTAHVEVVAVLDR